MFALLVLVLIPLISAQSTVGVGVYVLNLGKFDIATGTSTADFYLHLKCSKQCDPNFEFMNGRAASTDLITDEPKEKFYRIQANLNSPVDLRKFPFDRQQMQIILEDKLATTEELRYVPLKKQSGIDDSIAFTGWNIDGWEAEAKNHTYGIYDETYSQYVFTINISRIALNSFLKTFLPMVFIILVVLSSFILDPDKITTRLGMVGSSLVASVMFHVSITNQIPPVGYLTFADKFMILTYFVILGSFVVNILLLELQERKNTAFVEKIHRASEYSVFFIVPVLYVLLFLVLL